MSAETTTMRSTLPVNGAHAAGRARALALVGVADDAVSDVTQAKERGAPPETMARLNAAAITAQRELLDFIDAALRGAAREARHDG